QPAAIPCCPTVNALEQASARYSIKSVRIFRVHSDGIDRGAFRPDIEHRNRFALTSCERSSRKAQRDYGNRLCHSSHRFVVPLECEFRVTTTRKWALFGRPFS